MYPVGETLQDNGMLLRWSVWQLSVTKHLILLKLNLKGKYGYPKSLFFSGKFFHSGLKECSCGHFWGINV